MESYVTLLRDNRNYRSLWLGAVVSQLGDWFNLIAAASLIATLTDSGAAISYLFLARFLPLFWANGAGGGVLGLQRRTGYMGRMHRSLLRVGLPAFEALDRGGGSSDGEGRCRLSRIWGRCACPGRRRKRLLPRQHRIFRKSWRSR